MFKNFKFETPTEIENRRYVEDRIREYHCDSIDTIVGEINALLESEDITSISSRLTELSFHIEKIEVLDYSVKDQKKIIDCVNNIEGCISSKNDFTSKYLHQKITDLRKTGHYERVDNRFKVKEHFNIGDILKIENTSYEITQITPKGSLFLTWDNGSKAKLMSLQEAIALTETSLDLVLES